MLFELTIDGDTKLIPHPTDFSIGMPTADIIEDMVYYKSLCPREKRETSEFWFHLSCLTQTEVDYYSQIDRFDEAGNTPESYIAGIDEEVIPGIRKMVKLCLRTSRILKKREVLVEKRERDEVELVETKNEMEVLMRQAMEVGDLVYDMRWQINAVIVRLIREKDEVNLEAITLSTGAPARDAENTNIDG